MDGCVIMFETFPGEEEERFVIKELAIVDIEQELCRVVLFKPPYKHSRLSTKNARTADWLESYYHGLSWYDGAVEYAQLQTIIRDVCRTYSIVFTKGLEHTRFLSKFHSNVVDLNDQNATKYDNTLQDSWNRCCVKKHRHIKSNKYVYNCALRKAQHYAKWLRNDTITLQQVDSLKSFSALVKRGLYYDGVGIKCKTCGNYVFTRNQVS